MCMIVQVAHKIGFHPRYVFINAAKEANFSDFPRIGEKWYLDWLIGGDEPNNFVERYCRQIVESKKRM